MIGIGFVFLFTGSLQKLLACFRKDRIYIDIMVIAEITVSSDLL